MKKSQINFTPDKCEHCGQTKTYILKIDRGTVDIVKQLARFIGQKGVNCVHPRKEMEGTYLSSNQVGNLSRARFHGLIAAVKGNAGNYLLTPKGAKFLKGEAIAAYAVVSKAEKKQSWRVPWRKRVLGRYRVRYCRGAGGE